MKVYEKITRIYKQTLQYWQMGLLFHHVQGCQKAPAIVRHTDISQKNSKLVFVNAKD